VGALNRSISTSALADRLGVASITAIRWAAALGLRFPRRGPTRQTNRAADRAIRPRYRDRINLHRIKWLKAISGLSTHKGVARHHSTRRLYWWLARYDHTWLRTHLPRVKPRPLFTRSFDRVLAARVIKAANQIRRQPGPIRASRTRILHRVGKPSLQMKLHLLPITRAALNRICESPPAFVPRRLRWLHDASILSPRALRDALRKQPRLYHHALLKPVIG